MQNTNWDIYRYLIAVSEEGSAIAAAQRLGVNGSTVLRRITAYEKQRGIRLFDRLQSGYAPTAECKAILDAAHSIRRSAEEIERSLKGDDHSIDGRLKVTTTDTLAETILPKIFANFNKRHPGIHLDLAVTNDRLSLTSQDADIAIRVSNDPPQHLIGLRVAPVNFAVYGSKTNDAEPTSARSAKDWNSYRWIGIGDAIAGSPAQAWMTENIKASSVTVTADTFPSILACTAALEATALLPCFLGDRASHLQRLSDPFKNLRTNLWILTHPDLQKSAKVKLFTRFAAQELRAVKSLFSGHE